MKPAQRRSARGQLEWRRQRESDARWVHYVKPAGQHDHIVRPQGSDGTKRVGTLFANITYKPGTLVPVLSHTGEQAEVLLGRAPLEGASEHARAPVFEQAGLSIIRAVPPSVEAGATSVRLVGTGFSQSPLDVFSAVVWGGTATGWIADTFVTLTSPVWVDAENVDVTVTVDADLNPGYKINVQVLRIYDVPPT